MSSATDAPLVETTVPTDGQTPPQPATRPQPTTLAPRRMTGGPAAREVLAVVVAGAAVGAAVAAAVVGALILRNLLYQWRYEFAISLLVLLLVGTAFFRIIDLLELSDDR